MSVFERMKERYESGEVPWDSDSPPPEVTDLAGGLPPGKALDLGCGYGRASIFLAEQGWQLDAVDFVPEAISQAAERAKDAGVAAQIQFHVSSVTNLSFLKPPYDLALDVGCMHVLNHEELIGYRDELLRLLRPGAKYLLFVRLKPDEIGEEDAGPGIPDHMTRSLFADGFRLERVEYGETLIKDDAAWLSAWYWFHRL